MSGWIATNTSPINQDKKQVESKKSEHEILKININWVVFYKDKYPNDLWEIMCRIFMLSHMDFDIISCIVLGKVRVDGMKFIETKNKFFADAYSYGEDKRKDRDLVNEFPYLNLEWKDRDC